MARIPALQLRTICTTTILLIALLGQAGCFSCYGPVETADFDSELETWRLIGPQDDPGCHILVAGECDNGQINFLYELPIDAFLVRFFDAETGAYIGRADGGAFCGYSSPVSRRCRTGVITEVICGSFFYEVGDRIALVPGVR